MLGIVSIEDGDASVADVSGDFADNGVRSELKTYVITKGRNDVTT